MARIPLSPPRTILNRVAGIYSNHRFDTVIQPVAAVGHNARVAMTYARLERAVERWNGLDPTLAALAVMASAVRVGCSWCIDFGGWAFRSEGVDPAKLQDVPRWRESDRYTELERRVLEYAETISGEVGDVTDGLVEELRDRLGDAALVELTMLVAVENLRSRFNGALGLTDQGFMDRCEVPAA